MDFNVSFWVIDPETNKERQIFSYSQPSKPDWKKGDVLSYRLDNSIDEGNKFFESTQDEENWINKHLRFKELEITKVCYYFREDRTGRIKPKTVEELLLITTYCSAEIYVKIIEASWSKEKKQQLKSEE